MEQKVYILWTDEQGQHFESFYKSLAKAAVQELIKNGVVQEDIKVVEPAAVYDAEDYLEV